MKVRVLYHDNCFDGAASAAYFTRFLSDCLYPEAEFHYTGMAHKASQLFEDELFDGDENAIVDFKYSPHPRLTWWFDHHQSAFLSPEDEAHFRQDRSGKKMFDPNFRSCTAFIADRVRAGYGFEAADLKELVEWAEIIDGALYPDAKTAVDLNTPATQLMLVIENLRDARLMHQIIRWMSRRPLGDIIAEASIQEVFVPLHEKHLQSIEVIRERASLIGDVVYFDLVDSGFDSYNKFIPYWLFPEAVYTVSVSRPNFRTKVSVGSNPWAYKPPAHNLATICEHYGGGGHARVGAISFDRNAVEQARQAAREIVETLNR